MLRGKNGKMGGNQRMHFPAYQKIKVLIVSQIGIIFSAE